MKDHFKDPFKDFWKDHVKEVIIVPVTAELSRLTWNEVMQEAYERGTFEILRDLHARSFILCVGAGRNSGKWMVFSTFSEEIWPTFIGELGPAVVDAATKWVIVHAHST